MKKIVIITLIALFSGEIQAQQQKDYAYCIAQIDSLITVYSVDTIADISYNFSFQYADLSIDEKIKIINKIQTLFEQKQNTNLYAFGGILMNSMYFDQWNDNPVEIQQLLMDIYLQYYFYPRISSFALTFNITL